eukprot:SAG31_NODE_303_length_18065_cov_5.733107_5_plen_135_part_00
MHSHGLTMHRACSLNSWCLRIEFTVTQEEASRQNERTAQWVKQNREGGLPQVQWDRRTQRYVRAIPNNRASEVWSAAKTTPVAPTFQSAASSEMIDSANGNVAEGSVSAAPTLAPANSNAAPHSQQVELVLENG